MSEKQKQAATAAQETTVEASLIDQIVDEGRLAGRDAATRQRNKDIVKEFIGQFLEGSMTVSRDTEAMINARIAQIDHLVSIQLNEVMHHQDFQKLEASWRGLRMTMDRRQRRPQL